MRKIFLSFVFMVLGLSAMGKPVDVGTAERVARTFWNSHRDAEVSALKTPMTRIVCPFDGMYIFSAPEGGFVIVAADDRVQPVLAYSFSSPVTEELNAEVRYWLGGYQRQIDFVREHCDEATAEVSAAWEKWLTATAPAEPEPLTLVPPLISTTWGQGTYYNKFCPVDSNGYRTVVGCVATATAQVMKYWNHPAQGTGSHSYTLPGFGTISADFGSTTYNWSMMPTALGSRSTTAQDNAVATLMYHVGVSIEMNYGADASGAHMVNYGYSYNSRPSVQDALSMFFGYAPGIQAKYRTTSVADSTWKNYIRDEIAAARPVLYSGYDSEGGHCFVCDGYNSAETYFHFNWGWNGGYDGYYTLAALSPGGGGIGGNATYTFNDDQQILLGVQPDGASPIAPEQSDTISYCGNVPYGNSVGTSGGPMYWAIMLTPEQLANRNYVRSVMLYVHEAGNYTLKLYTGGTSSPGTLALTQTAQFAAADTMHWREILLNTTYAIDHTKNLWVVLYAPNLQHPASVCPYTQDPNSDWASTDGSSWSHLQSMSSSLAYSWLLKVVTSQSVPEAPPSVTVSGPSRLLVGASGTFTATPSSGATVMWSIPGGTPSSGSGNTVTVTFATPGNYNITATATNSAGSYSVDYPVVVVASDDPAHTDTLDYCGNRAKTAAMGTSGGPMHWAIMIPASLLTGQRYLKSVMNYFEEAGEYTLKIYADGTTGPGALVHSQTVTFGEGVNGWREVVVNTELPVDTTRNLWIVFATTGLNQPAALCSYSGDVNSDWASINGDEWSHLRDMSYNYSWLIKGVFISEQGTEGIVDADDVDWRLYPNPATDKVTLEGIPCGASVTVTDLAGRTLFVQALEPSGTQAFTLDVSRYPAGTYFVTLTTQQGSSVRKLIVK